MYSKNCLNCGKIILYYKSRLKRTSPLKYCSNLCKNNYRNSIPKEIKNCKHCGTSFEVEKNRRTTYCSKKCYIFFSKTRTGDRNHLWKGDKVEYFQLHKWICKNWGNPEKCELCFRKGEKEGRAWNIEWSNKNGLYRRDRNDWWGLCVKCHRKYDKTHRQTRALRVKRNGKYIGFYFYKRK